MMVVLSSLRFTNNMSLATIVLFLMLALRRDSLILAQTHQGTLQFSISSLGRKTNGVEVKLLEETSVTVVKMPSDASMKTLLGGRKTLIKWQKQEEKAVENGRTRKNSRGLMSSPFSQQSGENEKVVDQKELVKKRSSSSSSSDVVLHNKAYLERSDHQASRTQKLLCSSSKCTNMGLPPAAAAGLHHPESSDQQKITEKEIMSLMQKDYHDFWTHGGPKRRPPIHNVGPKN